jgi:uncharacterized protein YjiS (DUF1127 family)
MHNDSEQHPRRVRMPKGFWSGKMNRRKTMTSTTIGRNVTHSDSARSLPDFLTRVSSKVVSYVSRSRAERQLQALDDRLLADIGMRRSEIRRMVWGA